MGSSPLAISLLMELQLVEIHPVLLMTVFSVRVFKLIKISSEMRWLRGERGNLAASLIWPPHLGEK